MLMQECNPLFNRSKKLQDWLNQIIALQDIFATEAFEDFLSTSIGGKKGRQVGSEEWFTCPAEGPSKRIASLPVHTSNSLSQKEHVSSSAQPPSPPQPARTSLPMPRWKVPTQPPPKLALRHSAEKQMAAENNTSDEHETDAQSNNTARLAIAKFAYQARSGRELPFEKYDIIEIISADHMDWWFGKHTTADRLGFFPKTYVEVE